MIDKQALSEIPTIKELDRHLEQDSVLDSPHSDLQLFLKKQFAFRSPKRKEIQTILEKAESAAIPIHSFSKMSSTSTSQAHSRFDQSSYHEGHDGINPFDTSESTIQAKTRPSHIKTRALKQSVKTLAPQRPRFCSESTNQNTRGRRFSSIQQVTSPFSKQFEIEDDSEFVMIKPITMKMEDSVIFEGGSADFIELDASIFSDVLIQFVAQQRGNDERVVLRNLVQFLADHQDQDHPLSFKRPNSEILCSLLLKNKELASLRNLLKELTNRLHEEPVSVQEKYKDTISFFQAKLNQCSIQENNPLANKSVTSVQIEEKDLQRLDRDIESLRKEDYLISSKQILWTTGNYIRRLLQRFPPVYASETFKQRKGVVINYITLPKLLEKILEPSEFNFCRQFIAFTYDFYISPLNLLLYFIKSYFTPEPLNLSPVELEHIQTHLSKPRRLRVLKLIKFWVEERHQDFTLNPNLNFLLGIFLETIPPFASQGLDAVDSKISRTLKKLSSIYDELLQQTPKIVKKQINNGSYLEMCDINLKDKRNFSQKKTSAFTNPSFYLQFKKVGQTEEDDAEKKEEDAEQKNSPESHLERAMSFFSVFTRQEKKEPVKQSDPEYKKILEKSVEEIAKQLTLIDSKEFSKVNIREMVVKRWTKKDKSQCPTYFKFVSRFNAFSYWLQYIILTHKEFNDRMKIVRKFIDIALFCIKSYNNYSTPHYIFSAIASLKAFGVISFKGQLKDKFDELLKIYAAPGNYIEVYEKIFRNLHSSAVPSLIIFLRIFLKLQEGIAFKVKLPESEISYLKFPTLVHIQDYINEMRKFQRNDYELNLNKDPKIYKYLKKDFQADVPLDFEDSHEVMKSLVEMVKELDNRKRVKSVFGFGRRVEEG